ncbi:MAG: TonB-dependent receptor [Proteobacteria bacterium]|nr:TonB-dependent receptor [Pseudomonadota bacterium]
MTAIYGSIPAHAPAAEQNTASLEEIVVTATRHAQSAQDVPISITAISGSTLEGAGISDNVDLGHFVAGINVTDKGAFGGVNGSTLIIRGLNSDSTSGEFIQSVPIVQPVATYLDDTPLFFNLRLQDLERVEILRGPQGTLYGSGSLGGTIRYVQNAPDPNAFDAKVEAGVSDTAHTHDLNEDLFGMLNVPLSETFALRLNASYSGEAGFVDQPSLYQLNAAGEPIAAEPGNLLSPPVTYAQQGTNSNIYRGARIAALWRPSEALRLELSYYFQGSSAAGYPYAAPAYGLDALASSDYTRASTDDKVNLAALNIEYEMGFATLTSNTSFAKHDNTTVGDVTQLYVNFPFYPALYGMNPRVLITGHQGFEDKPFAQELRLASRTGGPTEWVAGLFYKYETTDIQEHDFYPGYYDYYNQCILTYGPGDGINPSQCGIGQTYPSPPIDGIPIVKDQAYIGDFQTKYTDLAGFGEFTWHFAPSWSVTGGTRLFRQTVSQSQQTGLLFDGPQYIANETRSNAWEKALWKVNIAYHLNAANLAYATWSQGFRRGAVNALPPAEPAVGYETPPGLFTVTPDTVDNYELGIKGTIGGRVRYSAAIFDMQWHNVQQFAFLTPLALPGAVNIGEAYSRGFESELHALLTDHFTVQLDYTYNPTKLTQYSDLALQGLTVPPPPAGSALPGTPKNTAAATLEYTLPLAAATMRFTGSAYYRGPQLPALSATIPTVGGYTMLGARISYERAHWLATLYGDNLTNTLGVNSYTDPVQWGKYYQALVSRPRTIGIVLSYSFRAH